MQYTIFEKQTDQNGYTYVILQFNSSEEAKKALDALYGVLYSSDMEVNALYGVGRYVTYFVYHPDVSRRFLEALDELKP